MNRAMREKLSQGEAIDVSGCRRTREGDYILEVFAREVDYCDKEAERWITSIGRHKKSGRMLASTTSKFYRNPDYESLYLR